MTDTPESPTGLHDLHTSPDLLELIRRASTIKMTPEQERAQRRSFVVGNLMLSHPEWTREFAEQLVDKAIDYLETPA